MQILHILTLSKNHQDISAAHEIQKEILLAYERDFSKYTTKTEAIRVSEVWQSIPMQLAKENKKFKYSDVSKGGRASRFESSIEWLRRTGLIIPSYHIKAPKLPLSGYSDPNKFKIYLLDTGSLGAILEWTPNQLFFRQKYSMNSKVHLLKILSQLS
jgi:hypothetical protein